MAATAQITRDQAAPVASAPGFVLRADAAAAWDRAVAAFGRHIILTGSWRSYETQERLFRDRYRQGDRRGQSGYTTDVRYWQGQPWTRRTGTAAAAVPGTSNHGGGVAVDVKTARDATDPPVSEAVVFTGWADEDRTAFLAAAAAHGWCDDEGRTVSEHWHITYYPARDRHRGEPAPTPTPAPTPPAPAGDDETEIILMPGYPFMFRADTQDGWTIALSPTRTVAVPVLKGDEGKALRALFGEPQIVGPEMARRLRETLR